MIVSDYIDDLIEINKPDFINLFQDHIREDPHEVKLFDHHKSLNGLKYFRGYINKIGLKNLVLPHHAVELEPGRDPDRPVKTGGDFFTKVISDYVTNYIPNKRFIACYKKSKSQMERFFNPNHQRLKADFLFISNDKKLAHRTNDYDSHCPDTSIFIGNGYHRLVAYGLFIEEYGFRPLEIHYVGE